VHSLFNLKEAERRIEQLKEAKKSWVRELSEQRAALQERKLEEKRRNFDEGYVDWKGVYY